MMRRRIWEILAGEDVDRGLPRAVNCFLLGLIALNVAAVVVDTVEPIRAAWGPLLDGFELASVLLFTLEYLLRLASCTADPRFARPVAGRLRWALTPLAVVDLLAVLPFYLPMFITLDLRFLRVLRLLRFVRLLKLGRYSRSLRLMAEVARAKREELTITVVLLVICLVFSASVVYLVEHDAQPDDFGSIPQAMWWSVATLSTVGYGDICPVTPLGKVFAACVAVAGIGLFGLPAGIVASGFMEALGERRSPEAPTSATAPHACPHCGGLIRIVLAGEPPGDAEH